METARERMLREREDAYSKARDRVYFTMFPSHVRNDPVCSYDCGHCGHHVGWMQFMSGRIPDKYTCHKCKRPVELMFSHDEKRIDVVRIGGQAYQNAQRVFYASEQYAAFLAQNGTLDRVEPDIEDEP